MSFGMKAAMGFWRWMGALLAAIPILVVVLIIAWATEEYQLAFWAAGILIVVWVPLTWMFMRLPSKEISSPP